MRTTIEAPVWLELPDQGPETFQLTEEESYWSCAGRYYADLDTRPLPDRWSHLFTTEAEARLSAQQVTGAWWKWDGLPPTRWAVATVLAYAREDGQSGVRLKSYQNGEWIVVKEWRI